MGARAVTLLPLAWACRGARFPFSTDSVHLRFVPTSMFVTESVIHERRIGPGDHHMRKAEHGGQRRFDFVGDTRHEAISQIIEFFGNLW